MENGAAHCSNAKHSSGQSARSTVSENVQMEGTQRLGRTNHDRSSPQSNNLLLKRRTQCRNNRLHFAQHGCQLASASGRKAECGVECGQQRRKQRVKGLEHQSVGKQHVSQYVLRCHKQTQQHCGQYSAYFYAQANTRSVAKRRY